MMERGLLMFRTNSNQDRVNYSNALLPPDGYVLEKAVGTTYSLDLAAEDMFLLVTVCLFRVTANRTGRSLLNRL